MRPAIFSVARYNINDYRLVKFIYQHGFGKNYDSIFLICGEPSQDLNNRAVENIITLLKRNRSIPVPLSSPYGGGEKMGRISM
jgi:hypothetical protein